MTKTKTLLSKRSCTTASTTRGLILILRELDVKVCVVTGTWTDACVQHTVMGAFCRGYESSVLLKDCCACPDETEHERALAYMKKFYGAQAIDSHAWIAKLEGKAAA